MPIDGPPSSIVSPSSISSKWSIPLATFFSQSPSHYFLATGCAVFHKDKLLLIQRAATDSFPGCWELPGGGCDLTDETILHAVVRELWEETGLHATRIVRQIGELMEFESNSGRSIAKVSFEVEVSETQKAGVTTMGTEGSNGGGGSAQTETGHLHEIAIKLDPQEHQAFMWATEEQVTKKAIGDGNDKELKFMSTEQHNALLEAFRSRRDSS